MESAFFCELIYCFLWNLIYNCISIENQLKIKDMKKLIYTTLLIFGTSTLFGQANFGTLKGKIVEDKTNEPVIEALVVLEVLGKKVMTKTDFDGKFTIKPLNPGTYNLLAISGMDTLRENGITINADKITFVNDLVMTDGLLGELTVRTYREKLIDPEDTKIVTIKAKQIAVLPVRTNINQIARTMSSEIQVSEDGNEIYFRGSRNGDVMYIVDGVKITGGRPTLPSSSIQAMRVYTGGIPAKYGDVLGGVIMVETKSYFDYYNIWKGEQEMKAYKESQKKAID